MHHMTPDTSQQCKAAAQATAEIGYMKGTSLVSDPKWATVCQWLVLCATLLCITLGLLTLCCRHHSNTHPETALLQGPLGLAQSFCAAGRF